MLGALVMFARTLLTVLLGVAFGGKVSSHTVFRSFVTSLGGFPWIASRSRLPVAVAIVGAEFVAVGLLLWNNTVLLGFILAAVLLGAFSIVPAVGLARGSRVTCRCFGVRSETIGTSHVLRNGIAFLVAVGGAVGEGSSGTTATSVALGK